MIKFWEREERRESSLLTFLDEDSVSVERLDEDVVRRVAVQRLFEALLIKVVTKVVRKELTKKSSQ